MGSYGCASYGYGLITGLCKCVCFFGGVLLVRVWLLCGFGIGAASMFACLFAVRVRELVCVEVHVCLVVLVVCFSFSNRICIYSKLDSPKMDFPKLD